MFGLKRTALHAVGCLLPSPPIFSGPLSFSLGFLFVALVFFFFCRFGNSASGARTEKLTMTNHLTVE